MAQELSERQQAVIKELMTRDDLDDRQKAIVNELESRFLPKSQQEPRSSVTPSPVQQQSFPAGNQPVAPPPAEIPRIRDGGPFSQFLATPESRQQTKEVFFEIASVAPEMTLGTIGAVVGFTVGGPPGAAGGAALGAGAGNALGQMLQRAELLPGIPPGTSEEAAKQIGIAAALGLVGEGVGQVAVKTGSKLINPFGAGANPRALRIQELLKDAPKKVDAEGNTVKTGFRDFFGFNKGLTLSPATVVDNAFLDLLDNVSRNSFITLSSLRKETDRIVNFFTDKVDDFVKNFAKAARTTDEAGLLFQEVLENGAEVHRSVGKVFYDGLDDVVGKTQLIEKKMVQTGTRQIDEGVDLITGKRIIKTQPILRQTEEISRGGVDLRPLKANIKELRKRKNITKGSEGLEKVFKWIEDNDDIISFSDAHDLRSDLAAIGRVDSDLIKGKAGGFAKGFSQRVDKQMQLAVEELQAVAPPELRRTISDMWRNADDFWKQGKELINGTVLRSIIRKDADGALDFIVKSKDKKARISLVREALIDNPKKALQKGNLTGGQRQELLGAIREGEILMNNLQSAWFERMMLDSLDLNDNLVGSKLLSNMKSFNGKRPFSQGPMREMFKGQNFEKMLEFVDTAKNLHLVQAPLPEGIGKVFIQLKQPGALEAVTKNIGQVIFGVGARISGMDTISNIIIFGPAVVQQIFTTPMLANFMINGIKTGAITRNTTTFLTRFAALLKSQGIESRLGTERDITKPVEPEQGETTTPMSPFSGLFPQ